MPKKSPQMELNVFRPSNAHLQFAFKNVLDQGLIGKISKKIDQKYFQG